MKNGEFHQTEDGIYLGEIDAKNESEAYTKIKMLNYNQNRVFDHVVLFEVKSKDHKA